MAPIAAMAKTTASSKSSVCTNCAATALNRRITTYPVRLTEPPTLAGREIHVGRVALYVCRACGHLMPTAAGQAKIERGVAISMRVFLGDLP
jgi:hypothetical protein